MYEALTKYIGQFEDVGTWIIDRENDGSKEHPIQMPYMSYSKAIMKFLSEMDAFMVYNYQEVLKRNDLRWGMEMGNADVSGFDAEAVLALDKTVNYKPGDKEEDKEETKKEDMLLTQSKLEDTTITGDLTISDRLGTKTITLEDVMEDLGKYL